MTDEGGPEVIHLLRGGLALCGKPGVPGAWEPGHTWVAADDDSTLQRSAANCAACLLDADVREKEQQQRDPELVTALATELADALREQMAGQRPRRRRKAAPDLTVSNDTVTEEQLTEWRVLAHGWADSDEIVTVPRGMVGRIVLRLLDAVVSGRGSVAVAKAKALDKVLVKLHGGQHGDGTEVEP